MHDFGLQDPGDRRQYFSPRCSKERNFVPLQQGLHFTLDDKTIFQKLFPKDLCQSLPLEYQEEAVHHGITTYR